MNTIIIFSDFQNSPQFYIFEGDYTYLNDTYINEVPDDEIAAQCQKDLSEMLELYPTVEKDFPVGLFYNESETTPVVITCGFIP